MPPPPEIIDLTNDSEDEAQAPVAAVRGVQLENYLGEQLGRVAAEPDNGAFADYFPELGQFNNPALPGMANLMDVPLVIDDFGYLDEDPQQEATTDPEDQPSPPSDAQQVLSQADCLARVYELFPDICPEHATKMCDQVDENSQVVLTAAALLDRVIEKLLADKTYPKRKKEAQNLKRKREESVDDDQARWEREDRGVLPGHVTASIRAMLKAEFPTFTHASIAQVMAQEKYLFNSYICLARLRDTDLIRRRGRAPTARSNAMTIAESAGWPQLGEELAAARRRASANTALRFEEAAKKKFEDDNLRNAKATGEIAECQACFDDLPMNRQIHCHGDVPHYTCFACIKTYIATEIGDARCRVMCTAGCGAGFEPAQLNNVDDKKLLQKLADLQQEKDIRDAGLEDLEECPFCDYKAILPPIEEDFEFRCANPGCEQVSCRRCKAVTHIPISCEQNAKDKKVNSRHTVEEAMTAALLRSCNKCKKQFIKEFGCNKMTCPSCKNLQCYVCSETLKGYDHFDQHPGGEPRRGGKCPLYDNLAERHEREVRVAGEAAAAQVIANNPDVAPEDLEIKVSDAVKKSTEQQIRAAGPEGLGGGGGGGWNGAIFGGGLLANNGHFFDNFDDDDDDDDEAVPDAGPEINGRLRARLQLDMLRGAGIAQPHDDLLPALIQNNMVPAGLHARHRRRHGRIQRAGEEAAREMMRDRAAHAFRPLNMVHHVQRPPPAQNAPPAAPPTPNVQQHNPIPVNEQERLMLNRFWEEPEPRMPHFPFQHGGLNAIFQDFEQFPQHVQPPFQPQQIAQPQPQPHGPAPLPLNALEPFQRGPVHVNRGFGLHRVRAQLPGIGVAGVDHNLEPPAAYAPQPLDFPMNAARANVQHHLDQLELMRQQHDERTGNVPAAVPGAQGPRPRGVARPARFGWP